MNKVEALQQTIYNLENDVYPYNWNNIESCNCGVLARTLLKGGGVWDSGFNQSPKIGPWYLGPFSEHAYCLTTNLPLPAVFAVLKEAGFTFQELKELEDLSNEEICEIGGVPYEAHTNFIHESRTVNGSREDKDSLIKYLKGWVQLLIMKQSKTSLIKEKTVYVSVPESITKQSKELILS